MGASELAAASTRLKIGGPLKVLLVLAPQALLQHMVDIAGSIEGVQLVGRCASAEDVSDWRVWDRRGWSLAYVDVTLPDAGDLVRGLLDGPHPGTVVGIVNHLSREVGESCAAMGVQAIIEKGDLIAFHSDLEARAR